MTRTRIAAVLASTVLTAGAGIGVANAAPSSSGSSSSATAQKQRPTQAERTAQLQKLAAELGVTVEQLRTALRSTRPDRGDRPAHGDRGCKGDAAALAEERGVETAAVQRISRPTARPAGAGRPAPTTGNGPTTGGSSPRSPRA